MILPLPLPLPLIPKPKPKAYLQTRRAAHMDVRRFPTEPWMASRKIAAGYVRQSELRRGKPFLLVTFLWAHQRKVTRLQAEALDPVRLDGGGQMDEKATSSASAVGGLLSLKGPKKVTKERPFPDRANSPRVAASGFSDSPSMARSENDRHPCRSPSGSGYMPAVAGVWGSRTTAAARATFRGAMPATTDLRENAQSDKLRA